LEELRLEITPEGRGFGGLTRLRNRGLQFPVSVVVFAPTGKALQGGGPDAAQKLEKCGFAAQIHRTGLAARPGIGGSNHHRRMALPAKSSWKTADNPK
jgi:hypothetical protein